MLNPEFIKNREFYAEITEEDERFKEIKGVMALLEAMEEDKRFISGINDNVCKDKAKVIFVACHGKHPVTVEYISQLFDENVEVITFDNYVYWWFRDVVEVWDWVDRLID